MEALSKPVAQPTIKASPGQLAIRLARTLTPSLMLLTLTVAAHAQGTIDLSGSTTWLNSIKTFAIYAGAVIAFVALIFSAIKFAGRDITGAIAGLAGVLFGAGVLGWGAGWISSLSGQSVQ